MKKILLSLNVFCLCFLVGCSEPATPEEIKSALNKCIGIKWDIAFHEERGGFGGASKPKIIKKSDLKKWLKECEKRRKSREDPNSEENIIKRQQSVLY
ncbi:hypothetical protein ACRJAL_003757 [Acinetobacter baumannii]|uniref:hypothetical protein n=1 Tax=Acinetobacter TaxID=469 RepID=UPI00289910B1|nr:hypothetical protein [Acinetobacter variabilis]